MSTLPVVLVLPTMLVLPIVAGLVALLLRRVAWVTRVSSVSMYPTLHPGQWVVTHRIRRADQVRRGDIVVADSAELDRRIIKRVIALAGDRVRVDARGLRINGHVVDEPYVTSPGGRAATFVVPVGTVVLLGDNRRASSDSRSWVRPYLPYEAIRGRVGRDDGRALV